jgi:hypothetical protein
MHRRTTGGLAKWAPCGIFVGDWKPWRKGVNSGHWGAAPVVILCSFDDCEKQHALGQE